MALGDTREWYFAGRDEVPEGLNFDPGGRDVRSVELRPAAKLLVLDGVPPEEAQGAGAVADYGSPGPDVTRRYAATAAALGAREWNHGRIELPRRKVGRVARRWQRPAPS